MPEQLRLGIDTSAVREVADRMQTRQYSEFGVLSTFQHRNVCRGLHPSGNALGDRNRSCGSCLMREADDRCGFFGASLHGDGTKMKVSWRACEKWSPRERMTAK